MRISRGRGESPDGSTAPRAHPPLGNTHTPSYSSAAATGTSHPRQQSGLSRSRNSPDPTDAPEPEPGDPSGAWSHHPQIHGPHSHPYPANPSPPSSQPDPEPPESPAQKPQTTHPNPHHLTPGSFVEPGVRERSGGRPLPRPHQSAHEAQLGHPPVRETMTTRGRSTAVNRAHQPPTPTPPGC